MPPTASYSFVGSEMYSICLFSAFYSYFQVTSGQMTSLPGLFLSPEITWRHFLSRDCLLLRATGLQEVKRTVYVSFRPSTATSRWLPAKSRRFWVTSGHLRSRDVISFHVTASSCELQSCRRWNVQETQVFGLLQPLSGDFRSNNVTSGSLPVTWGNVTSFPVTWLPPPASYSLVGSEMYSIRQFLAFYSHYQVTSGQMTSLLGHFRSPEVTWLFPSASCSLVGVEMYRIRQFLAFYTHFQVTSVQITSLPGHFRSPEVTWLHFLSRDCLLVRATALCEMKCTVYASFRPSTATSRWLPFKWRHFRVSSGHLRSRDVISCHVIASSCELQAFKKWNVLYTIVFNLVLQTPHELRYNHVTSVSLPVTWGHVTSILVTWLPPPASYSLLRRQIYSIRQFSAFYRHLQVTSGQITWFPGHFRSAEVTLRHFLSRDCLLL